MEASDINYGSAATRRHPRWQHSSGGQELVAETLAQHLRDDAVAIHDRVATGCAGHIDHIVVAPSGVWVIDTTRRKGKVRVAVPRVGRAALTVDGRDRTSLVVTLSQQVDAVGQTVAAMGDWVPVNGAFCFLYGDLPAVGTPRINNFPLLTRRGLTRRLNRRGPVEPGDVVTIARELARRFPPA